jgi:serine/threonine-protein kinase
MLSKPMAEFLASDDLIDDAPQPELRRGTRLGRYELLVPIAKGGMARVWAARLQGQRGFSKMVAVKTILPHLAEEPEFERMFLDEARIASGVHHPNVCEIYELGEEGKILYLAMEWVNGESLVTILRAGSAATGAGNAQPKVEPIHPHIAARIVSEAASGLHAAHNLTDDDGQPLGVVHRDVSPHNILISADGNVKVADFGVAKAMGQMTATAAGQIKGKMAYMAPEQVAGSRVDRRSDVFSLGVVLYEATTGRKPFEGDGDAQVMHAILTGNFLPPSKLMRGYPPELEQIIVRALSHEAAHRHATAERLHLALEGFIAKSGSVVTPSHIASVVTGRVGPFLERRKEKIRAAAQAPSAEDISASGAHVVSAGATPSLQSGSGVSPHASHSRQPSLPDATGPQSAALQPTGSGTAPAARMLAPAPASSSTMKYLLAASAGVGVACAVVIGAFAFLNKGKVDAPTAPSASASVVVVAAAPVASAAPSATAAPLVRPPIAFRVNVREAMLIVDGMAQDEVVRTLDRPKPGAKVSVSVQAPGYGDQTIILDENSPNVIDVNLPQQPSTPTPTPNGAASPARASGPAPTAIPANPFATPIAKPPPVVVPPPPVVVAPPPKPPAVPPKSNVTAPPKPGVVPPNPFGP